MTILARIRRYLLEHWIGPVHNHAEGYSRGGCTCWEDQGLRRPKARK